MSHCCSHSDFYPCQINSDIYQCRSPDHCHHQPVTGASAGQSESQQCTDWDCSTSIKWDTNVLMHGAGQRAQYIVNLTQISIYALWLFRYLNTVIWHECFLSLVLEALLSLTVMILTYRSCLTVPVFFVFFSTTA